MGVPIETSMTKTTHVEHCQLSQGCSLIRRYLGNTGPPDTKGQSTLKGGTTSVSMQRRVWHGCDTKQLLR